MERTDKWYVVYTRPGQEQKVCDSLRRKKIDSFYPVNKLVKSSYGKQRTSFKPLIERYVFVHIAQTQMEETKNVRGVVSFVYWLSQPIIIEQDDIYLMKRFCNTHDDLHLERIKVIPSEPAFISTRFSDHDTELVNFHFPVLGYNMIAEESKARVKIITITDYQAKTETSNSKYAETR